MVNAPHHDMSSWPKASERLVWAQGYKEPVARQAILPRSEAHQALWDALTKTAFGTLSWNNFFQSCIATAEMATLTEHPGSTPIKNPGILEILL